MYSLTAVVDVEMLYLNPHEDVIVELADVTAANLEVAHQMLALLQLIAISLKRDSLKRVTSFSTLRKRTSSL